MRRETYLGAASGGDLNATVRQIETAEAIGRTLQEHAGQPAYWVAAASLAPDRAQAMEYLKEAAKLYPDSPAVLSAMVQGFGSVLANMTEERLSAYVDGTILNGEFSTLQSIPEIAQALQQAHAPPPIPAAGTPPTQK